ncbi:hypothetical protein [Actinocorallia populi]|uniref:hypothetical protein n=1 Tax=Actinocorallia populi TaxID=2079200 RepID=UPI001E3ADBC2|nr:hypothetical protein [Actinocorallia populi]
MPSRKLISMLNTPEGLARAHGIFNIVGGAWPLAHRRSFEALFGPKQDEWLQQTTGALLVSAGCSQVLAARSPDGHVHACRTGLGTAATLLAIDLMYVPTGRIRWTYLLDGALEAAWIAAWLRMARRTRPSTTLESGHMASEDATSGRTASGGAQDGRAEPEGMASGRAVPGDVAVAGAGVGAAARTGASNMVTVEHVEQLLRTDDPGAALVAVGGRVEVVSSGEASGGLVVAEREDVLRTLPEGDRSPDALEKVARALDTAVSELGG